MFALLFKGRRIGEELSHGEQRFVVSPQHLVHWSGQVWLVAQTQTPVESRNNRIVPRGIPVLETELSMYVHLLYLLKVG